MTTLLADPVPALVTIPGVELVSVGEWDAVTGPVTFTEEHLRAAVAALADPAVHAPRLRIGHTAPDVNPTESAGGFADQPAFGRFVNLRLNDTGTSIVADMAGVPAWLAAIMPSAFPSRSIEAYFDVTTASGRKHDMVITSVALLGVSLPAVETLDDLRVAYGAEIPDGAEIDFATGDRVAATRGGAMPNKRASMSVSYEDVRRSFFEDFATEQAGRYWWWPARVFVDPPLVIADDDEGGLWSCPYAVSGETVTWKDPAEVRIQYVDVDSGKVAAARAATPERVYATAADSRPKDRVRAATATEKEATMGTIPTAVLERLELPEDATEEQALAKLDELKAETPPDGEGDGGEGDGTDTDTAPVEPQAVAAQKGLVVDPEAWAQAQADAKLGREAREEQIRAEREKVVDERVRGGFITSASRAAHLAELAKGGEIEKAHRAYLAGLTAAIVPVEERGTTGGDERTAIESQVQAGLAAAGIAPRKES